MAYSPLNKRNPRDAAVTLLHRVLDGGHSVSKMLPEIASKVADNDRGLLQELCYGVLRWHERLQVIQQMLMQKNLRNKDRDIAILIQLGLYQLLETSIPDHAVLQETVQVAKIRNKPWARGLVNGVLRRFQRERIELLDKALKSEQALYTHPLWMIELFKKDWPGHWQSICESANQRPPMTLRVNLRKINREAYLATLQSQGLSGSAHPTAVTAVVLDKPVAVTDLPGFADGWVSVQDAGAQLAAALLKPEPGMRVLDACAAPGGKTGHILEYADDLELTALDSDPGRCQRIIDNLNRLGLQANVLCADAADPAAWWDGVAFDAILLDVPCSALGVIRRHPDIKALRTAADLSNLVRLQNRMLEAIWPMLAGGGRLVYATCSVSKSENSEQILRFVNSHEDAKSIKIQANWGSADVHGRQILTGQENMDGFYYALIEKAG